jgi:hypothetical protein
VSPFKRVKIDVLIYDKRKNGHGIYHDVILIENPVMGYPTRSKEDYYLL